MLKFVTSPTHVAHDGDARGKNNGFLCKQNLFTQTQIITSKQNLSNMIHDFQCLECLKFIYIVEKSNSVDV